MIFFTFLRSTFSSLFSQCKDFMFPMTFASNSFVLFSWFSASWSHSSKYEFKNLKNENIFKIKNNEFIPWLALNIPIKDGKTYCKYSKKSLYYPSIDLYFFIVYLTCTLCLYDMHYTDKIFNIMNAIKLTCHNWYTIKIPDKPEPVQCPKHIFSLFPVVLLTSFILNSPLSFSFP